MHCISRIFAYCWLFTVFLFLLAQMHPSFLAVVTIAHAGQHMLQEATDPKSIRQEPPDVKRGSWFSAILVIGDGHCLQLKEWFPRHDELKGHCLTHRSLLSSGSGPESWTQQVLPSYTQHWSRFFLIEIISLVFFWPLWLTSAWRRKHVTLIWIVCLTEQVILQEKIFNSVSS